MRRLSALPPALSTQARLSVRRVTNLIRRHQCFTLALFVGALLRLLVTLAYPPAFFGYDSIQYIEAANRLEVLPDRPVGYAIMLKGLSFFHSFALIADLQHLLGLAVGVLVYVLLRRVRIGPICATAASLPVLFNAHEIQLEHLIFSDTLFLFLAIGGVALLFVRPASVYWSGFAGVALAAASITRSLGIALVFICVVFLLARRAGWRSASAFVLCACLTLAGYAGWYKSQQGRFALTTSDGIFLYARTTSFSDCSRIKPPASLRVLCVSAPPGSRPDPTSFVWHQTPLNRISSPIFKAATNDLALKFAKTAILAQPVEYVRAVWVDLARGFSWSEKTYPNRIVMREYSFPEHLRLSEIGTRGALTHIMAYERGNPNTITRPGLSAAVDGYARAARLRGPVLAVMVLIALVGCVTSGYCSKEQRRLLLLFTLSGLTLLLIPPLTITFDYRYVLPAIPFLSASTALVLSGGFAAARAWWLRESDSLGNRFVNFRAQSSKPDKIWGRSPR